MANPGGVPDISLTPAPRYRGFMVKTKAADVVDRFARALEARDFSGARRLLADNLRFEGPIDRFDNADDYIKAISGLYGMVKGVDHQAAIADGDEVATFYRLDTPAATAPVAEWYTVRGEKIARIRTYFDARPFIRPPTQP